MIEANANLELAVSDINDRLAAMDKLVNRVARHESQTPRILRRPVGLRSDQPYAIVGGPDRGRQWHVRRVQVTASAFPVNLYNDESLSAASLLWTFETGPVQETWGREEMVLVNPDILVLAVLGSDGAPLSGATLAGQVQIVDQTLYGVWHEPQDT